MTFLPPAEDIHCPLGHAVYLATTNQYTYNHSFCDVCGEDIVDWDIGIYHCSVPDCPATVVPNCRGWDICVDCAVRQYFSTQQARRLRPANPTRHDETAMQTHTHNPSRTWGKLPYDTIHVVLEFVGLMNMSIRMVNRMTFHLVGRTCDMILHRSRCFVCKEGFGTTTPTPYCHVCLHHFHPTCIHVPSCTSCSLPLAPGAHVEFRTSQSNCLLCRTHHSFLLPPQKDTYRVQNSGNPIADGVYSRSTMPSNGVPIYTRDITTRPSEPLPSSHNLPALLRQHGAWKLVLLGDNSIGDIPLWECDAEDPPESRTPEFASHRVWTKVGGLEDEELKFSITKL
eukprot:PhF_6_TR39133/c0_g1_i1/m.58565